MLLWSLGSGSTGSAAEEAVRLLTITGDLHGEIEGLDGASTPGILIARYYGLLEPQRRMRAETLQRSLAALAVDYRVAFAAADTAELNEVVDELMQQWFAIRTLHRQQFQAAVADQIYGAYLKLYPFLE